MPDLRRRRCRHCHRHDSECGAISWSGSCEDCAAVNVMDNALGLHEHRGPAFLRWRRAMAASVGGAIMDDVIGER